MEELVMPMNYVEMTDEEMMYLEGSGFFKRVWNAIKKNCISIAVGIAKGVRNLVRTGSINGGSGSRNNSIKF